MPCWGISNKAPEKEKIKSRYADYINGLNCVGEIDYPTYCELFDEGMKLFDEMYELGKKDATERPDCPECPICETDAKMVWWEEYKEWRCHGTHVRDD